MSKAIAELTLANMIEGKILQRATGKNKCSLKAGVLLIVHFTNSKGKKSFFKKKKYTYLK